MRPSIATASGAIRPHVVSCYGSVRASGAAGGVRPWEMMLCVRVQEMLLCIRRRGRGPTTGNVAVQAAPAEMMLCMRRRGRAPALAFRIRRQLHSLGAQELAFAGSCTFLTRHGGSGSWTLACCVSFSCCKRLVLGGVYVTDPVVATFSGP